MIGVRKLACSVFFAALALATHHATAQFPGPPSAGMIQAPPALVPQKRDVDAEVSQMTKRYDLSTSQVAQIRTLLKDETKKTEAMSKDESLSPVQRLMKLNSLRYEEIARVSPILNPEQREKYVKDLQTMSLPQFQTPANLPPPSQSPAGPGPAAS